MTSPSSSPSSSPASPPSGTGHFPVGGFVLGFLGGIVAALALWGVLVLLGVASGAAALISIVAVGGLSCVYLMTLGARRRRA